MSFHLNYLIIKLCKNAIINDNESKLIAISIIITENQFHLSEKSLEIAICFNRFSNSFEIK